MGERCIARAEVRGGNPMLVKAGDIGPPELRLNGQIVAADERTQ